MAALAGQRLPAGRRPGEAGDAEPGARSEHHLGGALGRRPAADLVQVGGPQVGQHMGEGLEVVEDEQRLDADGGPELVVDQRPGGVGEPHRIPHHRRRHRNGRHCGPLGVSVQIGGHDRLQRRELRTAEARRAGNPQGRKIGHGQPRIGAANVGHQGRLRLARRGSGGVDGHGAPSTRKSCPARVPHTRKAWRDHLPKVRPASERQVAAGRLVRRRAMGVPATAAAIEIRGDQPQA